jgi:cathepsin L
MENFFHRFNIFKKNLAAVEAHNKQDKSFTLGMNHFSDLTNEEFKASYVGKLTLP